MWEYPSWDILRCSLVRGNTWLQNWAGFPPHTCPIMHMLFFKISYIITDYMRICLKQVCSSWPIGSLSLPENSTPSLGRETSLCAMGTAVQLRVPRHIPTHVKQHLFVFALISPPPPPRVISVSFMKWLLHARRERPNEMAPVREEQVDLQ